MIAHEVRDAIANRVPSGVTLEAFRRGVRVKGPRGCGKTTAIVGAADALRIPCVSLDLSLTAYSALSNFPSHSLVLVDSSAGYLPAALDALCDAFDSCWVREANVEALNLLTGGSEA